MGDQIMARLDSYGINVVPLGDKKHSEQWMVTWKHRRFMRIVAKNYYEAMVKAMEMIAGYHETAIE